MPIPKDITQELARTAADLEEARAQALRRREARRKREFAREQAEARARNWATFRAREIWTWLEGDGQALAALLRKHRLNGVTLIENAHNGHRGSLHLNRRGELEISRRTGPAWGDEGVISSPSDLARRSRAEVIHELADLIRDGRIWERIRENLKGFRKIAGRIAEDDLWLEELEDLEDVD